jgi:HSP20 family molecular chaperone IbpA
LALPLLPLRTTRRSPIATFKNGVLAVTLPKGTEAKVITIPIKTE